MTVEEKALIWARKQKGNVLNNKNVDCFIAGYNMAAKEYKAVIDNGYKEIFTGLSEKLKEQLEEDEHGIALSGYMYSYPDWFVRKKFKDIYELFVHNVFFDSYEDFRMAADNAMFGSVDCKKFLEQKYNIKF